VRSHLFAAWQYELEQWQFGSPDVLRLARNVKYVDRLIKLNEGEDWTVVGRTLSAIRLQPTASFIRDSRARGAVPETPAAPPAGQVPAESNAGGAGIEPPTYVYVDEVRLAELRTLESPNFDLRKLIALCEELNICYRSQCYHAVAALTRAVLDHVPPIFGQTTFLQAASNSTGGRSVKAALRRLEEAARNIGDAHLHQQVRKSEVLPTRTQVNFSNELDVLLGEVVRLLRP
jgi:hypothetical protein